MFRMFCVFGIFLALLCPFANAQDFSVDPLSPEVPATFSPADIVAGGGRIVTYPATSLGLVAGDNVDGFSYGQDVMQPAALGNWVYLHFSVTRATVGVAGGAVNAQAAGNGAAGDVFWARIPFGGPPSPPFLGVDATWNGLTPLPPPQSDVDGISYPPLGAVVYLSVDAATAARLGVGTADILYQAAPGPGAPPPVIFATAAQLGLAAGDDIDALAVSDLGVVGTLDAADIVFISLTPGSPSAAGLGGAASVIQVWPAPPMVAIPPAQLQLLATDDINAITCYDPGCGYPDCGDANGDGVVNISDVIYLINYLFIGGSPPVADCCAGQKK